MSTINQIIKGCRLKKKHKSMVSALKNCPQVKGICIRVFTMSPKKPNSAIRKVARIRLSNGMNITACIPGLGHSLQQNSLVSVRGGRANDLPGVRYKLIRGKYDFTLAERIRRNKKRSKFGVKKWKK